MEKEFENVLKNNRYKYLRLDKLKGLDDRQDLLFRDLKRTSLGFNTGAAERIIDFLYEKFELSDKEQFKKMFEESISGDGDELSKNNALHSSSLCALLFFYNVKNKPIEYEGITYDDVYFEVRNKVIGRPSNMDVVLTGKDKENKDSILFIECKFSEFFGKGAYELPKGYREEPYKHIFDDFKYDKWPVFQEGLKQLVAHYFGICNFVAGTEKYRKDMEKYYAKEDRRINLYRKFENVSFIEVVYDFKEEKDFKDYREETECVFETLKQEKEKTKVNINLLGTTTYQEFFKNNLKQVDDRVLKFYGLAE